MLLEGHKKIVVVKVLLCIIKATCAFLPCSIPQQYWINLSVSCSEKDGWKKVVPVCGVCK